MNSKKSNGRSRHVCRSCLVKVKKYNVNCPYCGEFFLNHLFYVSLIGFAVFSMIIVTMLALRL